MKRLVVVADNSLIVEAIAIGMRKSGEFSVVGRVSGLNASAQTVLDGSPDVVLVEDMGQSPRILELIKEIKAEQESAVVIVLTLVMDSEWLDDAFEAGVVGAISKATHPLAVTTLVRETVDRRVLHVYEPVSQSNSSRKHTVTVTGVSLTPREAEVLQLVASGYSNGEIAQSLWVTEQTVKFHLSNLYRKLDVGNRTEASHYAHVNGLVGASGSLRRSPDLAR